MLPPSPPRGRRPLNTLPLTQAVWLRRAAICCAALCCVSAYAAEASARGRLRMESGPAVDSNVTRIEDRQGAPISSGLLRVIGVLQGQSRLGSRGSLYGQYQGGGKRFFDRPGEDVLLQRLTVGAGAPVTAGGAVAVGGAITVRDRSTRDPFLPRDYLRATAELGPDFTVARWRLSLRGSAERFYFKPSADQSSAGIGGRATLSGRLGPLRLTAGVTGQRRRFEGPRLLQASLQGNAPPLILPLSDTHREDTLGVISAQAQYVGRWVAALRYVRVGNRSNTFGGGLTQHRIELSATGSLPWSMVLSGAVGVQRTRYDEQIALSAEADAPTILLDDENRSSVTFRVLKPISGPWGVTAHGGVWFSPFASDQPFRRQVLGLSLAYQERL